MESDSQVIEEQPVQIGGGYSVLRLPAFVQDGHVPPGRHVLHAQVVHPNKPSQTFQHSIRKVNGELAQRNQPRAIQTHPEEIGNCSLHLCPLHSIPNCQAQRLEGHLRP